MWRTRSLLFFYLASLPFADHAATAGALRVDESTTRVLIQSDKLEVLLAVENSTTSEIAGHVKIELLDPRSRVRATAESNESIRPGASTVRIPAALAVSALSRESRRELLWYRLRYRIDALNSTSPNEGAISLSEITPSLFELRVATSRTARASLRLRATVRAVHPTQLRAVGGVAVTGRLELDQRRILEASAITDSDGYAPLEFDLPASVPKDEIRIRVIGTLGGLTEEVEDEIELDGYARILTSTDKPLYQPGQILHVRALVFDSSNHAVADHEVTLRITDPENTLVFRSALKTSRFGVASADWQIPANARLGQYLVLLEVDDDQYRHSSGGQYVNISRYDLPNFAVAVKPDRAYYLPGQTAEVEVRADYLFGQPVKRGQARIVRENQREWNFKEQKWEVEEGDKWEGKIEDGRFVARINLAEMYRELADEDYSRFRDIEYAAYVTDPTTNRTEQRRFRLRVTREPIHIYVVKRNSARRFPLAFYLSTFYADGTPARCEVSIADTDSRLLRTIKTNDYGVAKIAELQLPQGDQVLASDYSEHEATLILTARDARGHAGHRSEDFSFGYENRPVVHVETNKTLYRAGEAINVRIAASESALSLVVDALCDSRVVHSQLVSLRNGQASITVPYSADLTDEVTIAAYSNGGLRRPIAGAHTVLYSRERDLKLDVKLGQAVYKPGEEARADFQVRTADGRAVESALGVVVLDRAVEERARTNQEFGTSPGFYGVFQSYDRLAGITRKDLDRIDLSKPLPEGLELVAEILLNRDNRDEEYSPKIFGESHYEVDQRKVFGPLYETQMRPIKDALATRYARTSQYPSTEDALRRMLAESGIEFEAVRDPWGTPYLARFSIDKQMDVVEFISPGADKQFGSRDGFTIARIARPYFRPVGEAIGRALERHHTRTSGYIRDVVELRRELAKEGVNLDSLRDRWGRPYVFEFGVDRFYFTVNVKSGGPNARFDQANDPATDDFIVWTARIDFFQDTRTKIEDAVTTYFKSSWRFPQNEAEFAVPLKRAGINADSLRDGWGHRCYVSFKTESRYPGREIIESYAEYRAIQGRQSKVIPIAQLTTFILVRGVGEDGKMGTSDDFTLATLSSAVAEQLSKDPSPKPLRRFRSRSGATGAITGSVDDSQGAVIVGAKITATQATSLLTYDEESHGDGRYALRNLPPGTYDVRFEAPGFRTIVFTEVPVSSSNVTELNASLYPQGVTETVTVAAGGSAPVETPSYSMTEVVVSRQVTNLPLLARNNVSVVTKAGTTGQMSTPRLREYFPETLVWQPSLETDARGVAQLKFKLADNITTWKVGVVASTVDGQIGIAEQELRAFQPFFVEHDPPRVLTVGDEIMLPVVLRNYLDRPQSVDVKMKPESWFTLLGGSRRRTEAAAGDAARALFGFRAVESIADGRQRITATAAEASDAIEKPVSVHPDGEEITETATAVLTDSSTLEINFPETAIKGSMKGELKIYPNLMAHVIEGIEAIMQRPYGCGEQTISSTYPSLLVLRHYKQSGEDFPPVAQKARRYLEAGYGRLLNYRSDDGGFTYWGRGEADTALTAYALRLLSDARDLIAVDEDVIRDASAWLVKHQSADGSWPEHYRSGQPDATGSATLTSYIARVLAVAAKRAAALNATDPASVKRAETSAAALKRALDYLALRAGVIDEPYMLASYALAAFDAGQAAAATQAVNRLSSLAHDEGSASYWSLETNTPFYGWGLAGRIETTALVVQALARQSQNPQSSNRTPELTNRGLLFLIRQKDGYGVWLSTQATINVMDALMGLSPKQDANPSSATSSPALIFVNGQRAASVAMPPALRLSGPITIDLSRFLSRGGNRVEIRRDRATQATAQVVASFYSPWANSIGANEPKPSNALRLGVSFDKTEARIGDEINCMVQAERVGFRGYGMMLAEIGLPPGADVDRASLDRAVKETDSGVDQYDVLPDRLIVYLWPRAGGTRFEFKFRPRFGLVAQTAPSVVYDYYNPEARAVVAPTRFIVK